MDFYFLRVIDWLGFMEDHKMLFTAQTSFLMRAQYIIYVITKLSATWDLVWSLMYTTQFLKSHV